jgi:hypothetical protein
LIEVISESVENNVDALRESLAEEGYNYDDLVSEGLHFIHSLEREMRFDNARKNQNRLMQLLNEVRTSTYMGTKGELLATLKTMFSGNLAAAYFQKLELIHEADLKKIIKETEILELFADELKSENDNE